MSQTEEHELRSEHLPWIWGGAFFIVGVFGLGLTPWNAITQLIESQGVGDQEAYLLAFVAGYTMPATAAIAVIVALIYSGTFEEIGFVGAVISSALILALSAVLSQFLGLGLIVDWSNATWHWGPLWVSILLFVLEAYINSYGWPLMISALALGIAGGLHYSLKVNEQKASSGGDSSAS